MSDSPQQKQEEYLFLSVADQDHLELLKFRAENAKLQMELLDAGQYKDDQEYSLRKHKRQQSKLFFRDKKRKMEKDYNAFFQELCDKFEIPKEFFGIDEDTGAIIDLRKKGISVGSEGE